MRLFLIEFSFDLLTFFIRAIRDPESLTQAILEEAERALRERIYSHLSQCRSFTTAAKWTQHPAVQAVKDGRWLVDLGSCDDPLLAEILSRAAIRYMVRVLEIVSVASLL